MSTERAPSVGVVAADPVGMGGGLSIRAEGVTRAFRSGATSVTALRGVDLEVGAGEVLGIVGVSGSGKSTLLGLLGGLDLPTSGRVLLDGRPTGELRGAERLALRRSVGLVFQDYRLLAELNALENVMAPAVPFERSRTLRARARGLLEELGLGERLAHLPGTLSGGEQQRVALARALVGPTRLLLADEPTGNLDRTTADAVTDALLAAVDQRGITAVVATHDPGVARRCGRVVELDGGRLREA